MRGPTLLVIEDAADQAVLVGVAARRAHPGLDVRHTHDGLDGIAYLAGIAPFEGRREHPLPNLVILDLYMPELDGFEVLTWIRDHMRPTPFPVVVLTASAKSEDEQRALELGAVAVHAKPESLHELDAVVRGIVDRWIGKGRIIDAHIWSMG